MGIIHRDLKPENVLLDARSGNVRITDFNAALFVQNGGQPLADGDVFTQEKVGSEPYLAWETARRQWYGKMVDWWALGCVMFDLLTNTVSVVHTYCVWTDHGIGRCALRLPGLAADPPIPSHGAVGGSGAASFISRSAVC